MKVFIGVVFFSLSLAIAQVDSGSISGTVTDGSGAVVPRVSVTVTETNTNYRNQLSTNDSGFYSAPGLRPGRYEVSVANAGFRPEKSRPFELRVQDHVEMNFQLQVGAATSEVTVSATAPLLESETSSLGQVFEQKNVTDLPLNGRNFVQLATLTAGALPSTRTAERDNFISNGARAVQNSYLLDGVDNKNRIFGFDKGSAQIISPMIDSIQEFKVQTATFSAEFGQAAGGVVNVTLKSGSNAFHGNVLEFLRNSKMDATPYFQGVGGAGKGLFIQNQYGATFGGPILKDRTFFFGAWQSSREVNDAPQVGSVPTLAIRAGNFGATRIYDPNTTRASGTTFIRDQFPNNVIPLNRFDPVAVKFLALYPAPTTTGAANNYFTNAKERVSSDQYNTRFDHRFNSRDFVFVRVAQNWGENFLPNTLPAPANQSGFTDITGRHIAASETHAFTPTKINEFRFGFVFTRSNQDVLGPRLFDEFGIKGALDTPKIKGLPQISPSGFSALGTVAPGNTPIPASGSGNYPADKSGKVYQLLDNFSWIHNRHTIKLGLDLSRVTMYVYATNAARPNFQFNGVYTQNPQSRAGTGSSFADFQLGQVSAVSASQQQIDTILQYVNQGYVQDDWKISKRLTLNLGLRYELSTPWVEEYDRQSNFFMGGPCAGQELTVAQAGKCGVGRSLVHTDWNNFAPRAGLAFQATSKTVLRSGFGIFFGRDEDVGINRRLPNDPPFIPTVAFTTDQITPNIILSQGLPGNSLSLVSSGAQPTINAYPVDWATPYVVQFNVNMEQTLGHEFVAQVGYTGSEAKKLFVVNDINQPFIGPGAVNSRRPYQAFGPIEYYAGLANSNYNALIAKLERRFSGGLSLLTSYTYGHSIDNGANQNDASDPGPQNSRDLNAQRGNSNFDIRQRFVTSALYALPFDHVHGFLGMLAHGWQINGIFATQTGQPFTVTNNADQTVTGVTARPNRLRDGSLPSDQRSIGRWFDLGAFATPACQCYGNSGRGILRGPGLTNVDLSVMRNFVFHERYRLQFRFESFNLANHPDFGLPAFTLGNAAAGTINTVISPERQLQLAMKFYF